MFLFLFISSKKIYLYLIGYTLIKCNDRVITNNRKIDMNWSKGVFKFVLNNAEFTTLLLVTH